MWFSTKTVPSDKALLLAVASLTASTILLRTIANDLVPDSFKDHFFTHLQKISSSLSFILRLSLKSLMASHLIKCSALLTFTWVKSCHLRRRGSKLTKPDKERGLQVTVDRNQELVDVFKGLKLKLVLLSSSRNHRLLSNKKNNTDGMLKEEICYFELSFHKKNREMVLSSYLPYVATILSPKKNCKYRKGVSF
ncbi:hypothetical protein PTKIN_Ptkin13bG0010200 [Pterospermum kingtungense]